MVYIIDISEECGTPIEKQVALFRKIKPLFQGKPVFVMLNKIDVKPWDELIPENKALLEEFLKEEDVKFYKTSNVSKEGIMDLRNEACDDLLRQVSNNRPTNRKIKFEVTRPTLRSDQPMASLSSLQFSNSLRPFLFSNNF